MTDQSAIAGHYLQDVLRQLGKYRQLAERAGAQVSDAQFFASVDGYSNSIAIIMQHVAGNQRSRWTDFLTTDGEKPDRNRDAEFVIAHGETRAAIERRWREGWELTLRAVAALGPGDLERTVTIRGEPHTVLEAVSRQLTHYAYHTGQIVLLARHFAGERWRWLSIPPGKSREYDVSKEGERYEAG